MPSDLNIIDNIRSLSQKHNLIQQVMLTLSGKKLETLSEQELLVIENTLLTTIKKAQLNK